MAPIPLKCVVSVSSEDPLNPAKNILHSGKVGKKWLKSPSDKSGCLEMVLELCKKAKITAIEVGNFGSAFIEVLVGNSDSPNEFITLLPSSMLMTIPDSKAGRSRTKVKVFTSKDKLSGAAVGKKWNRVKIKCLQRHNSDQFGLQFITFSSDVGHHDSAGGSVTSVGTPSRGHSHLLTPPQLISKGHTLTTPKSEPQMFRSRLPVLHKTSTPAAVVRSTKTPKRPLKERNSQERETGDDFEFSGVEKQSRLFRNCMKGKSSTTGDHTSDREPNPILDRIMTEREKYASSPPGALYQRKKLLKRDLPKAAAAKVDFAASYKDSGGGGKKKGGELSCAWSKMSSHDNDYEIGEEPEHTWGWNRYKGKTRKGGRGKTRHDSATLDGWLNKRKKINNLIDECDAILTSASDRLSKSKDHSTNEAPSLTAVNLSSLPGTTKKDGEEDSDSDTVDYDYEEKEGAGLQTGSKASTMVECPLCGQLFPHYAIEVHAGGCGENSSSVGASVYGMAMPIIID